MRCPSCGSRDPKLHPATQSGGEVVHICSDEFHTPVDPPGSSWMNNSFWTNNSLEHQRQIDSTIDYSGTDEGES
jgi:hypothetical protein